MLYKSSSVSEITRQRTPRPAHLGYEVCGRLNAVHASLDCVQTAVQHLIGLIGSRSAASMQFLEVRNHLQTDKGHARWLSRYFTLTLFSESSFERLCWAQLAQLRPYGRTAFVWLTPVANVRIIPAWHRERFLQLEKTAQKRIKLYRLLLLSTQQGDQQLNVDLGTVRLAAGRGWLRM